jgi:excisionase family DNA binding protein
MQEHSLSDVPLTLPEAAKYLQVSTRVLREWCNRNLIRYSRANYRRWYFRRSDLDAFLDRRTVNPKGVYA